MFGSFRNLKFSRAKLKTLLAPPAVRQPQPASRQRPHHERPLTPLAFEPLEGRRLLSGGPFGFEGGFGGGNGVGPVIQTITFSQAPSAVKTGLDALATTDGVTAPTSSTTVYLGNSNGIESYTVDITGTGTDTQLTVDQNGKPVTAPTQSSTTYGAITNASVTAEIKAIASALSLTAPTSTTVVNVSTASDGTATYTLALSSSSSSSTTGLDGTTIISVNSSGNPVGDESVPLSTLSSTIQDALKSNAPSGATALTSTSLIDVQTADGVTTYTADYTASGANTTVTVNSVGTLTSLPSSTTVQFAAIPAAAQTELQTLATGDGVATAISSTQTVTEYVESNGTTIYSVTLDATSSSGSASSTTYSITLSVDAEGNPTVPPQDFSGGGCAGTTYPGSTGTTTTSTGETSASSSVVNSGVKHASTSTVGTSSASTSKSSTRAKTAAKTLVHHHKHHKA